jgi:hypothetical protein
MKYDFNKCTKEQLVKFTEYHTQPASQLRITNEEWNNQYKNICRDIYATAEVKLRTRAEVDADIAKVIRDYVRLTGLMPGEMGCGKTWLTQTQPSLKTLLNEETQG